MKYQAIKQLKTKAKLLKMCDTLQEAHDIIKKDGAIFDGFSYFGGFPQYIKYRTTQNNPISYNIQGFNENLGIVCSLDDEEKKNFNFSD